jgi:hypothetical protein
MFSLLKSNNEVKVEIPFVIVILCCQVNSLKEALHLYVSYK